MGEAKRKQTATALFIQKFPHCFFCAGRRASTAQEHMPPKSLFDNSHGPDKLVMPACDECNRETSTVDLVAAIISRWTYTTYKQETDDYRKLTTRMRRQAPDIVDEWVIRDPAPI